MITRSLNLLGINLWEESQLIAKGEKFNLAGYWKHGGITLRQQ